MSESEVCQVSGEYLVSNDAEGARSMLFHGRARLLYVGSCMLHGFGLRHLENSDSDSDRDASMLGRSEC